MWPITLSGRLLIVDLVGRYLTNYLIRREPTSHRIAPFTSIGCPIVVLCGISTSFDALFPCVRQVAHALLTRPPLGYIRASSPITSFDLHVLSTPPAFVLSQDQTLVFNPSTCDLWVRAAPSLSFAFALVRFPPPSLSASVPSALRPVSQVKTHFRINCRFYLNLSVSFSRFSRSQGFRLSPSAPRLRSLAGPFPERLVIIPRPPPDCQQLF